ncbi:MAG: hypothetical protein ACXWEV_02685 [Methylobacter sp.]
MSDKTHSEEDIRNVRQIVEDLNGDRSLFLRKRRRYFLFEDTTELLDYLLRRVQTYEQSERQFLNPERRLEFLGDLDAVVQLMNFYQSLNISGVVVFTSVQNDYGAYPIFDIFSRNARTSISTGRDSSDVIDENNSRIDLKNWILSIVDASPDIKIIDSELALTGFLTLFVDTLRAAVKVFSSPGSATVTFTLHSNNSNYKVDYYPQYRYTPVRFGSGVTTPVKGILPTAGYYCFQGWLNNGPVKDHGTYYAGPNNSSAHVTAF